MEHSITQEQRTLIIKVMLDTGLAASSKRTLLFGGLSGVKDTLDEHSVPRDQLMSDVHTLAEVILANGHWALPIYLGNAIDLLKGQLAASTIKGMLDELTTTSSKALTACKVWIIIPDFPGADLDRQRIDDLFQRVDATHLFVVDNQTKAVTDDTIARALGQIAQHAGPRWLWIIGKSSKDHWDRPIFRVSPKYPA